MTSNSRENVFDEIMVQVGNSGRFQKFYNIMFNLIFICFASMANFSPIISIASPEHWCKVPGREFTNFSLEEWKKLTIPWTNASGYKFSYCTMFNRTNETRNDNIISECLHGWEYDQTYYTQTIVSQENWVCDQKLRATNLLVFGKVGEILGTLLSQLGDIYGRRPVLYVSILTLVIGRIGLLISKGIYWLFIAFLIFGNLSSVAIFQAPLIISVEISSVEDRTYISLFQCIGWTVGLCVVPMIFWIVGDWVVFTIITSLPLLLFLFVQTYMIESPRWLASRGQMKKCIVELRTIAKLNKTTISDKVLVALNNKSTPPEKNFGVTTLFSSWNLAKKTLLVITGWSCYMIIYLILLLNVSNLKGNPFVNYFCQGLAELPGYALGKYLCDAIGRKYTKFVSFIAMGVGAVILAYILSFSGNVILISASGIFMKFISSITFYAINLQTIEIYPTCLRQTGASIGFLLAGIFGILAPYSTYLGTSVNPSLPYIISAILALIGTISSIFLPETLNEKLPETISEAEQFGADQKIWSLPRGKIFSHQIVTNNHAV